MRALQDFSALSGRLLLALIFLFEGWVQIRDPAAVVDYMAGYGLPGFLFPAVILTELGGGLLVAAGFLTRIAALALAGFCLLTALLFHSDFGDPNQELHFYKNLAMAGGFLVLAAFGPGAWSLQGWLGRRTG